MTRIYVNLNLIIIITELKISNSYLSSEVFDKPEFQELLSNQFN